jgi:hypothetical protein
MLLVVKVIKSNGFGQVIKKLNTKKKWNLTNECRVLFQSEPYIKTLTTLLLSGLKRLVGFTGSESINPIADRLYSSQIIINCT